jgi:SAM-dependent methyltransferase
MPQLNINRALEISGWMDEAELLWLAEQAQCHKDIVEIGSWMGRSTRALADNTEGSVWAVDTWKGSDEHTHLLEGKSENWLYEEFQRNMEGLPKGRLYPFRDLSLAAAECFQRMKIKFDMVFIDADHGYECAKDDIQAWRKLLVPGGLLCGHDYGPLGSWPGVQQAVDELVPDRVLEAGYIWCKYV